MSFFTTDTSSKSLLAFDFDGVLAKPYTHPEKHYEQVPELIKSLSEKYHLCVVSFNPRAKLAIEAWGLSKYFAGIRAGSNEEWTGYCPEFYRNNMTKATQICNITKYNVSGGVGKIVLFDDDPANIADFRKFFPVLGAQAVLIDSLYGLQAEDIMKAFK